MSPFELHAGDCRDVMATLSAESADAIVTDPPYGLSFMGKGWDHGVPGVEFWTEALRVAKPGAHLLAFGGTRTFHRLTCAIEDAGWEIRDCVMWVYGSGFPKSLDVSKAIDKAAGAEREVVPSKWAERYPNGPKGNQFSVGNGSDGTRIGTPTDTAPATPEAAQWAGWGTALKPAWEPVIVARKPLVGTVAENVLKHGTGAINVDGCRVGTIAEKPGGKIRTVRHFDGSEPPDADAAPPDPHPLGRWPANLIHDGSEEVVAGFPETGGGGKPRQRERLSSAVPYTGRYRPEYAPYGDTAGGGGSASRFFYCAKASKADRDEGCEGLALVRESDRDAHDLPGGDNPRNRTNAPRRNHHPTVKPAALMRYLCRLVTPPGGLVLDPFMGSGSTGKGALLEGFRFLGIEREPEYLEIARARLAHAERAALDVEPDEQQMTIGMVAP